MYCMASRRVLPQLPEEERQRLLTQAHLHTLVEMLEARASEKHGYLPHLN